MSRSKAVGRVEKNRRHLVSLICAGLGGALLLALAGFYGFEHVVVWASGLVYLGLFFLRTVFVEFGVLRK